MKKWVTAQSVSLSFFLLAGQAEAAGKRKIAIDPGHQGSWVDMSAQEAMLPVHRKRRPKPPQERRDVFRGAGV